MRNRVVKALALMLALAVGAHAEGKISIVEVWGGMVEGALTIHLYMTPESADPNAKQIQAAVCYYLAEFGVKPPARYEFYRWSPVPAGGFEPLKVAEGKMLSCDTPLKEA